MDGAKWKDKQLIDRLKQGDRDTKSELYDDYAPVFFSAICRLIKQEDKWEPLLQRVFERIFSEVQSFDESRQNLFIWMFIIVQQEILEAHNGSGSL